MTLTEKIAYIRGLTEGLKLDESKDEVKVINAIIELLEDMAYSIADLEDFTDEMSLQLDEVDEDLATLEDEIYEDICDCDCDDDCDCCDCCDDDCDCCDCCDDDCDCDCVYYEVTCPKCEETICVDEDLLLEGEVMCPGCGEILEFDFSELDGCGCGCDCGCEDEE